MDFKRVGIATVRIYDLEKSFRWSSANSFYVIELNIPMSTPSNISKFNSIKLSMSWDKSNVLYKKLHKNLSQIANDDNEFVLLYSGKDLIAVGYKGEDRWVDIKDFEIKTFKNLDIIFKSLTVN